MDEKAGAKQPPGVVLRKKDYCEGAGIHQKVALEQSKRFGLPYHTSGKTVDVLEVCAAWHRWATKHKHGITRMLRSENLQVALQDDEDGSFDFWQKELVKEKTLKERDARQRREGAMLPRELFHDFLQEFYIEPMQRRLEALDNRGDETSQELADSLRDDIRVFEEGLEIVFSDDEEHLSESS